MVIYAIDICFLFLRWLVPPSYDNTTVGPSAELEAMARA